METERVVSYSPVCLHFKIGFHAILKTCSSLSEEILIIIILAPGTEQTDI